MYQIGGAENKVKHTREGVRVLGTETFAECAADPEMNAG
jgi:hypothetical protein